MLVQKKCHNDKIKDGIQWPYLLTNLNKIIGMQLDHKQYILDNFDKNLTSSPRGDAIKRLLQC